MKEYIYYAFANWLYMYVGSTASNSLLFILYQKYPILLACVPRWFGEVMNES